MIIFTYLKASPKLKVKKGSDKTQELIIMAMPCVLSEYRLTQKTEKLSFPTDV